MTGLVVAAVLLCAIGSAHAQTSSPGESGPSAPNAGKAEPPQTPAPAQPPAQEPKPDGFTVGGFTFKPGGRIKLDIIRDFSAITSEDSFDPRTIPIDGSEGGNSQLHAKETRLFLDMRGPVEGKELRMYVETDFYGSSSVLRLRHAYGSWGGLLAGQTWSTFVDENNMPDTIDFESPMAFPSIRQAQVRWTQKLSPSVSWSVAVEDNKSSITPPAAPGKAEYPMPDLTTRLRFEGSRGHVLGAFFLGRARFRPDGGRAGRRDALGLLLSAKVKTVGKDYAYGQFTFGDGVGRYRGGMTAVPDANGAAAAPSGSPRSWAATSTTGPPALVERGLQPWRRRRRRTSTRTTSTRRSITPPSISSTGFCQDRAWAGVEYLHGRREVVSDQDGTANRLQFAVRFNLP